MLAFVPIKAGESYDLLSASSDQRMQLIWYTGLKVRGILVQFAFPVLIARSTEDRKRSVTTQAVTQRERK